MLKEEEARGVAGDGEGGAVRIGGADLRIGFRAGGVAGAARCMGRRVSLQGWVICRDLAPLFFFQNSTNFIFS